MHLLQHMLVICLCRILWKGLACLAQIDINPNRCGFVQGLAILSTVCRRNDDKKDNASNMIKNLLRRTNMKMFPF